MPLRINVTTDIQHCSKHESSQILVYMFVVKLRNVKLYLVI